MAVLILLESVARWVMSSPHRMQMSQHAQRAGRASVDHTSRLTSSVEPYIMGTIQSWKLFHTEHPVSTAAQFTVGEISSELQTGAKADYDPDSKV